MLFNIAACVLYNYLSKCEGCTSCRYFKIHSIKLANADLRNGKVKFLIRGGIVSTYIKGQELFEKKYGIDYYDFGCVMPSNISIEDYNKVVASFLDRKYGKGWRKEVRKDIQGI